MRVGPKTVFELDPTPKIAPNGPKSAKEAKKLAELKIKRWGYASKTKVDWLHRFQKFFEHDPDPKNSPNGQKTAKVQNKKIELYFQNQS